MSILLLPFIVSCTNPSAKTYSVSYDGNGATGGTVPNDSGLYTTGAKATVLDNTGTLVKADYSFGGWNTAKDGSGTSYAAGASLTMGSANVILYAKWTAIPPITLLAIPGVSVLGGYSPSTSVETSQYTGSVSWTPEVSDVFTSCTVYTATITLTPKAGYSLTGVQANSFTVSGATATNDAGSGVVTAVFPETSNFDLASGRPVTTSSYEGGFTGSWLVDGDMETQWSAGSSGPAWFSVDLGGTRSIKTIKFYPYYVLPNGSTSGTVEFSLLGSNDGTEWVDIKNAVSLPVTGDADSANNLQTVSGLDAQCRYVKLVASTTWPGWVGGYEFQVYSR